MTHNIYIVLVVLGVWFGVHWGYVLCMAAKAALKEGTLTTYWKVTLAVPAIVSVVLDFVFQFTFGWVMFLETPIRGGLMFSGRVQYHVDSSSGWRLRLATFWKRNLNVFDKHIRERQS